MMGINLEVEEDKIEERRDCVIDMVLDLLIEIENGDVELLNIEKQWLPDTIGLESVTLTYQNKRIPEVEFTFRTMQREGMV
jgi:hypothetical protein